MADKKSHSDEDSRAIELCDPQKSGFKPGRGTSL